ncbi:MAG: hypothetical protein CM1200mP3_07440 [Chloroflexota bacterium]|nr:MAG: hypothetical protein CM1200mP3_07440 [Chloroflexota bacterium]
MHFGSGLLAPHPSYYEALKPVLRLSKGIAHITGGGLYENVPRILPDSLGWSSIQVVGRNQKFF